MAFNDEITRLLGNRSAYLDFSHRGNAGATEWPDPLVKLYGKMPDHRGEYPIEGTVMGFGTLTRGVYNVDFSLEIPSITIELIDPDNFWRERALDPVYLLYRWVQLYLRAGMAVMQPQDPAILMRFYDERISTGQIVSASFGAAKKVSLECQLTGGKHLGELIPRRTVTTTDFPRCPPENLGKAVPIVWGVYSNALDAYGLPIGGSGGCRPRKNILMQESWANGNGVAFSTYLWDYWWDDPYDPLYPLLRYQEANYVHVDYPLVGYGRNVLWLRPELNWDEYWGYGGPAFHKLGELPWSIDDPWIMFDATDVWMTFTYYPSADALFSRDWGGFIYAPMVMTWDDSGLAYGIETAFCDYYEDPATGDYIESTEDLWLNIQIPTARNYSRIASDDEWVDDLQPGVEVFQVPLGKRIDLVDKRMEFIVCWKAGTYHYTPGYPNSWDGEATVAKDGYFRIYLNGALFFAKENHDLVLEDGWFWEEGNDHANQQQTVAFGWYGQIGPLTGIVITNGTEEEPVKPPCAEDAETAVNLASGALPALLVDTGKKPTHPDYVDSPFKPVDGMPKVEGHEAHNVFGGGTIKKAVFFYVAARKETGDIGPISNIVDLDNAYDPNQAAHAASLSWWKEGDATAYVVWMTQDPNFHPVERPTLGSPRTKIIRAINHSQFPPIDEELGPFDYQVKFTSLQDGAPYGAGATEGGYRYLLAGHTLQGVDQVYALKPMPTAKADAEVNTLQENVPLGGSTIRVAFDSDNDNLAKFQKDNLVIIAGDPDAYTITSSDEGTHGISPPARRAFSTGTVVSQAENVDTQVLLREGADYTQQVIEVNNNRYHTLVFPVPQQNPETCAQFPITCNVRGSEINSDGTGVLIDHGVSITQHFFKNWIFNDYRSSIGDPRIAPSGNKWFEDVPYQPGLINNASFYAANLVASGRVVHSYRGAGALTEQITATQLITDLITSFDLDLFFDTSTGQGAWSVAMFNPEDIVRSQVPQITADDIVRDTFTLDLGTMTPHANVLPYFAGPLTGRLVGADEENSGFLIAGEFRDPTSIDKFGQMTAEPLELKWTRHAETAYNVAQHRLQMLKMPAVHASLTVPIGRVNESLATIVAVTHPDGLGPNGWHQRLCRVMRSDVDLDRMVLHLVLRDIDDLVGP